MSLSAQSLRDWANLPKIIRQQTENKLLRCLDQRCLIPSLQAHKARYGEGIWIGYITVNKGGYRMLFNIQQNGILYVERLISHEEMDKLLGKF